MYGKPSTLFTWLAKSERPLATTASGRAAFATSGMISGSGFASANTSGRGAIERSMSPLTMPPTDRPRNTSVPFIASARSPSSTSRAKRALYSLMSSASRLASVMIPFESTSSMFSGRTPSSSQCSEHDSADAPAPETTTFTSSMFFSTTSSPFSSAAPEMMAVPCWSSCITGMSNSSTSLRSISKHSGAAMSSRLIPPKVGAILFTVSTNESTSFASSSMSNTSMSANALNSSAFPSITGLLASAPISPRPSTAVPFEMTATRFPLAVYL